MTKAVFLVYSSHGKWWIDLDGTASGPYSTRTVAITQAIPMAKQMERTGRPAEVLAPGDDRRHHVAWPSPARRRHETTTAG